MESKPTHDERTDLALVNIQSDVIHRFHGGASLVSLNQRVR